MTVPYCYELLPVLNLNRYWFNSIFQTANTGSSTWLDHDSDVTWASRLLKSSTTRLFAVIQVNNKESIKPRHNSQWKLQYSLLATRFAAYSGCKWPYSTKGLAFYVDWFFWHGLYFVKTYNQAYVWCCKYVKKITVKDVSIKYNCFFVPYVWEQGVHPTSSGRLEILSSSPYIH